MKLFVRAMLCAAVPLLSSCQTEPKASRNIITETEDAIWREAICATDDAILISHGDILTVKTADVIGRHNNDIWCKCPQKRPEGFDAKAVCKI